MSRLENKLREWQSAGLVEEAQVTRILAFENRQGGIPWAQYGFIMLGIVVVAIGLISLVAFNWDRISDGTKLTVDFLLLVVLAGGTFVAARRGWRIGFEAILLLYVLLALGSVGLISQVFNTSGETYQAIGLWCFMTAPLVFLTSSRIFVHFWIAGFVFTVFDYMHTNRVAQTDVINLFVLLYLPLTFLVIGIAVRFVGRSGPNRLLARSFGAWCLLFVLAATVWFSIRPANNNLLQYLSSGEYLAHAAVILALSGGLLWFTQAFSRRSVLLVILATACLLLMPLNHVTRLDSEVFAALTFLLAWMSLALFFSLLRWKRIFDALLAGAGVRFVIIYFEVFGDLATTGLGLIVSGLLIIALALLFIKFKDRISVWTQRIGGI